MAILKDSGDRREFDTGAVRDMAEGKGRMDLIPWGIALGIRTCMHYHYDCYGQNMDIESILNCFSDIEFHLNNADSQILKEKFELAAARWIMHHYYYAADNIPFETSVDFRGSDGIISYDTIDRIWATAMMDVAKHFEDGAKKYSDNNWRKGIPLWCFFDSGSRHLMKYILNWDDEPHDRAVLWNLMCGAWTVTHDNDRVDCASDALYEKHQCGAYDSSENC